MAAECGHFDHEVAAGLRLGWCDDPASAEPCPGDADALIADAQLAALVKELREVASRPVRPWVAYRAADALERILGQGADAVSE